MLLTRRPGLHAAPVRQQPEPDGAGLTAGDPSLRRRAHQVVGLLLGSYLVFGVVWALSNPAPSGTDEPAHYIKALAAGQGEFFGAHALFPYRDPAVPNVLYFWDQTTRAFRVPAQQAPAATFACDAGGSDVPATCVSGTRCVRWAAPCSGSPPVTGYVVLPTYVGDYEPTMYVVPGLLARLASNDVNGLRLARLAELLIALLLLTAAALLLLDRRTVALSLVGLVITATPMVIYINSMLNPNGGEIISSICFAAAMLRIWRDRGRPARWVWLVAGSSGALLGFSRVFGPLWVAITIATTVALLGPRSSLRAVRGAGWPALAAIGLVAAGVLADLAWWRLVGQPRSRVPLTTFPRYLWTLVNDVPQLFEQQIGAFGWGEGDISMSAPGYIVWSVMALTVLVLSTLVASARQRLVLLTLIAANLVFTVVVGAAMRVSFDFAGGTGILGRYVLPWSVVITLTAGEILRRNSARLGPLLPRNLLVHLVVGAGFCHVLSVWMAAQRFAVGTAGRLFFLPDSQWSPHFGWVPWLALAGLGALMMIAAGVLATRLPTAVSVATVWNREAVTGGLTDVADSRR
jgi:hypothetical protein